MKIRVKNVLGVQSAEFEAVGTTLVGGHNAAGKSSLIEAIACVIRGEHRARGIRTKTDAAKLIRDGAHTGSATIEWDGGKRRVNWPEAEVLEEGTTQQLISPLAAGATRWMTLTDRERTAELSERLQMHPTKDDLVAFLRPRNVDEPTIDAVWDLIDRQGWDAAHKRATDQATKLKGRWEEAARTAWGAKKAAGWRPILLDDAEVFEIADAEAAVARARQTVEQLVAAGAVSEDALQRARAAAGDFGPAQAAEAAARAKIAELDAAIQKAEADRDKLPPVETALHTYPCPHCERPVWLHRQRATDPYELRKPPPELPADEIKKRRLARQAIDHAIAALERDMITAKRELQDLLPRLQAAHQAVKRMTELEKRPKVTDGTLGRARADQAQAEAVLDAVKRWKTATEIYAEWERSQPIIEALAPDGVRALRVSEAIGTLNERLKAIAATAGFGTVTMETDGTAHMNGRPYSFLSESEQWRVDLTITLAFAQMEQADVKLVLVDRLDLLTPQARPGVFLALRSVGIPAVVCMTAKEPSAIPNLHQIKAPGSNDVFGRTYWMEAGCLSLVD